MFRFIDLFAGIGGLRIAFERTGGRCVFSSEIDPYCRKTYSTNFGDIPFGDITHISSNKIPNHDVLLAGFPCQPFSLAGLKKGFKDKRGSLFHNIINIIKIKNPKIILLENVKHMIYHDDGNTLKTICESLRNCRYHVYYKIINASLTVPQNRERLYIVAVKKNIDFTFPSFTNKHPKLKDVLEKHVGKKYTLRDGTWLALQKHRQKHLKRGNGFGYALADVNGISKTLSARYHKDGAEILIPQSRKNPRRLTPFECSKLMGFPNSFKIPVSDSQAYRQFGNSVVVPVVTKIAKSIISQYFGSKE